MKKLTIWTVLSSWMIYVLVPFAYKSLYGKYPENMNSLGYVPEAYLTKAGIIITGVLFLSILLIALIPGGRRPVVDTIDGGAAYYYAALAVYFVLALAAGVRDYNGVVLGQLNGSLMAYYSMLFYPVVLFLTVFFCVRSKGSLLILVGSYLALTLLTHSRSGAVYLGIYLVGFALTDEGAAHVKQLGKRVSELTRKYKKQIGLLVLGLIVLAPFIYIYSTHSRGTVSSSAGHSTLELMAARCSCLDEAGLALYQREAGLLREDIFREKYGLLHQLGCIVDSTMPGSFFGGDVDPNQYYRAMVGYLSLEDCARYYTSINLTLPIYLVMKYGLFGGIVFSTAMIVGFYLLASRLRSPVWRVALVMLVLREGIYFFDWVMIWKTLLRTALTILVFTLATQRFRFGKPRLRPERIRLRR